MKHKFEKALKSNQQALFDQFYSPIMITTPEVDGEDLEILYVNSAFCEMSGYEKDEIIGQSPKILQGEKTEHLELKKIKESIKLESYFEAQTMNYKKDGSSYWVQFNITELKDSGGNAIAYVSCQKDITLEHLFYQHSKIFQRAIDQTRAEIALFDTNAKYVYANPSYLERTGYSLLDLLGKSANILKSGMHDEAYYKNLWASLLKGKSFEALFHNKNANGKIYHEKQTITPIKESGELLGFVVIGKNYDDEYTKNSNLILRTRTDVLTGIHNREYLDFRLKEAIYNYENKNLSFCMAFVDLDNFKNVNDSEGHDTGDKVLKKIAEILKESIRKSDDIFRYGGDEFVFLLYDVDEKKALQIVDKLDQKLHECELYEKYDIGISMGLSEYKGEIEQDFFKLTDKKMYDQKMKHKQEAKQDSL